MWWIKSSADKGFYVNSFRYRHGKSSQAFNVGARLNRLSSDVDCSWTVTVKRVRLKSSFHFFFHLIILDILWGDSATRLGVKCCVVQSAAVKVLQGPSGTIFLLLCPRSRDCSTKDTVNEFIWKGEKKVRWMEMDLIMADGWIGKGSWIEALGRSHLCLKVNGASSRTLDGLQI